MGLAEAFKAAAQTAFTAAGNVPETVTYRSKTSASADFDPVESELSSDLYTDYDSLKMIISNSESKQNDGRVILAQDCDAMIPGDNLTPEPKLHDLIIRNSTEIWDIVWFDTDSARALWTFQIRKL
ncbi:MAG: hypothetical protein ACYTEU_06900 [Planctomycetota bacterium]|jgi:hypothetical protein